MKKTGQMQGQSPLEYWMVTLKKGGEKPLRLSLGFANKKDVTRFCENHGYRLISLKPAVGRQAKGRIPKPTLIQRRVTFENLAACLEGGLHLGEAFIIAGPTPALHLRLCHFYFLMGLGYHWDLLMPHYPDLFHGMAPALLKAGLASGRLGDSCHHLARFYGFQTSFQHKLKKILTYPMIVFGLLMGVLILFYGYLFPQVSLFLEGYGATPQDAAFSWGSFVAWGLAICAFAMAFLGLGSLVYPPWKSYGTQLLYTLPLVGPVMTSLTWWMTFHTYEMLLNSHFHAYEALVAIKGHMAPSPIQRDLSGFMDRWDRGAPLEDALMAMKTLEPSMKTLFLVSLKSQNHGKPVAACCQLMTQEVDRQSHRLAMLLEPTALAIMGGVMLILVVTVFGPLYDQMMDWGPMP